MPTLRGFPPGKSGGLIEASPMTRTWHTVTAGFRRVNPAASLKPLWVSLLLVPLVPVSAG